MSLYGLAKFITGFLLAIALLFLAGAATARYVITRLTELPPRPVFANDSPLPKETAQSPAAAESAAAPAAPTEAAAPAPSPAGTQARINETIGLVIREGPGTDTPRLGGVAYNEIVTVLETSPDGEWERIRVGEGGIEGWVKSGNTDPVN